MKRQIASIILSVGLIASFTACGSKNNANVLKEMGAANQSDALVAAFGKIAYRYTNYGADDTITGNYIYKDEKQHVIETDGYIMIDDSGDVYGFDDAQKRAYRYLFVGNAYEPFQKEWDYLSGYSYDEDKEKVTSQETKDGMVSVDTEVTDEAYINKTTEEYGYEPGAVQKVLTCYELDEKTQAIEKITVCIEGADGTRKLLAECERVAEPETYLPDEQLKQMVFEGDLRTVTVTADKGTDKETIYTQTISKGNDICLEVPPEYGTMYTDADCTMPYAYDDDVNEDLNLYVKSEG